MYENRNFAIFSTTELDQVDFSQVLETSKDTVRTNVVGDKTFVKWDGEQPPQTVQELTTVEGFYFYNEMLEILSGEEWTAPMEEIE
jgi:hypothetical protein